MLALRIKTSIASGAVLALGLLALLALAGSPAAHAGGGCPNATSEPGEASVGEFRQSIVCLINKERTSRGRDALDGNGDLRKVDESHSKVMVNQDCFKHRCSGEPSLERRLKNVGYIRSGDIYAFGQVTGYENTPRKMINRLMNSQSHRSIILDGALRDIGGGAAKGAPVPGAPDGQFVTYTVTMGVVR